MDSTYRGCPFHNLGHRNIQHTVRYPELAADRFKGFWQD
jgi:type 1 fimbriae regulatory protein FimE